MGARDLRLKEGVLKVTQTPRTGRGWGVCLKNSGWFQILWHPILQAFIYSFNHSINHLLSKFVLSTFCAPSTVLSTGNNSSKLRNKAPAPVEQHSSVGDKQKSRMDHWPECGQCYGENKGEKGNVNDGVSLTLSKEGPEKAPLKYRL